MNAEELIATLVKTGKWSSQQARWGIRANFKCEYCGLDLLENEGAYLLWSQDHIKPTTAGGEWSDDNMAIACHACNSTIKGRWDPSTGPGVTPDRESLLNAARNHVMKNRAAVAEQLSESKKAIEQYRASLDCNVPR